MPSRFISLAILIYWSIAAFLLLTWDVIPELTLGYAPDLRAIALAGDSGRPVRWRIQIVDDPRHPDVRRTVGESVTASTRRADRWFEMTSRVDLDAGGLLKGTPFASRSGERLAVESLYLVDPSGNLNSFELSVTQKDKSLLKVTGQLKGRKMELVSRGPVQILNQNLSFDYEPRSVVSDVLGPMDRLPGLHVGQKWESRMINPITAAINPISSQVESARVEVVRRGLINWEGNPVTTFEVVHRTSLGSMRTWVRTDGVVLRQEIPLPFVRLVLVLERRDEQESAIPMGLQAGNSRQMIELCGVTKRFGNKCAVDHLDLEVRPGELFAFLGPNGAGKTTTIKMICGLLSPNGGTVRVGGHDASTQQARQLMGYVPDQPYLYDKLTGREFLKFVVEMYGLDRQRSAQRIEQLIATFEMSDYADELCETYSQGMKQRVVFASALVHEPKVLVVDEPLVGLDPRSARIVKDLFISQARSGCTVLMSTHLLAIAEELADRIGIVDHGRMLAVGTLEELRMQVQHRGPLEELFLKVTGDHRPGDIMTGAKQLAGSEP